MSQSATKEFGRWRSFFWPVHTFELKKILPMLLMFFCISFNYTILRDTKDTLIVTAPGSGAEAIPFIKVWLVVPSAIIFMLIFTQKKVLPIFNRCVNGAQAPLPFAIVNYLADALMRSR